ncbi:MAG: RHS repeat protein, partial [Chlamydiia bacterium]|nr:RHS repeat protein [Chlamydiia bacterium]
MKKRFWNLLIPLVSVASAFGLQPNPSVVEEGVNTVTGDFEMNYRCLSIGEWHLNLTYREGKWEAAPVDLFSEMEQSVVADPLYPLRLSTTREGLTEVLLLNPQETLPVGQLIIEHTKKGIHLSSHQGDSVHLTRSDRLVKSLANSKHPSISFTYDAGKIATIRQGNRLKEIVWREGRVAEIWETTDQRRCQVQFHYGKRETEILFASGKKIINHFDAAGQLLERTLKIGNKEVRRECLRWENGAIKSAWIVGSQGEILTCTTFHYDAAGHKIEETEWGNLTGACTKPILLDASSHPKTNGVEHYTRHWKYAGDLLIEEWEDNGHKACYTYAPGTVRLTQKETERGTESYEYDTLGRLIAVKQSKGERTTYHYGNQPYQVEPEEIRQSGITTTRFYDPSGNLIQESVTNPWGDPVSHKALGYDAEGRPTTILTVSQSATHLEQITYNQLGEVVKRDVDDHAEAYCYDRLGQLIATRNQWGHLTRHTYDPLGRLTQTVYPEVATVDKGVIQPTVHLFYDSLDRISQMIDPAGDTTQFHYTSRGDLIAVLYADGTQETFTYPLEGQLDNNNSPNLPRLEGPSPLPYSETCTLNSRGQRVMLTTAVDQQGVAIEILHDALGRMERLTKRDPEGNLLQEVEYGYDANGNLAKEVHRRTDTDTYTISRHYGPNRRLIAEVDGNDQSTFYRYTAKGEIAEVVQPDGRSLNYTWDAAGHLSTLSASDQSFAYHYSYDEKGRVTAVIDAITGQKTTRRYDEFGNMIAEQLANGLTLSRSVDLYGRTTLLTLPDQSA